MERQMIDAIAGVYIALCAALSSEGSRLANDALLEFANDPRTPEDEARFYRQLAESARTNDPRHEDAKPYCWLSDLLTNADLRTAN